MNTADTRERRIGRGPEIFPTHTVKVSPTNTMGIENPATNQQFLTKQMSASHHVSRRQMKHQGLTASQVNFTTHNN